MTIFRSGDAVIEFVFAVLASPVFWISFVLALGVGLIPGDD